MNEIPNIITERVDDIPLLLEQMQRMSLPTLLDTHFPTHGNWQGNRSGCENRNYAAACDFWSLLGSRDGAASPRKAASCAAVRYSKTLRCCCFNVATTVIMLATKREPSSL